MKNNDKRIIYIYIYFQQFVSPFFHSRQRQNDAAHVSFFCSNRYQVSAIHRSPEWKNCRDIYKKKKNTITIFFQQFVSSFLTRIATKVRGKKKERVGGRKKKSKAKSLIEYQYLRLSRKLNGYIQEG